MFRENKQETGTEMGSCTTLEKTLNPREGAMWNEPPGEELYALEEGVTPCRNLPGREVESLYLTIHPSSSSLTPTSQLSNSVEGRGWGPQLQATCTSLHSAEWRERGLGLKGLKEDIPGIDSNLQVFFFFLNLHFLFNPAASPDSSIFLLKMSTL